MSIRYSTCHPERVHYAKGLCKSCYNVSKPNSKTTKERRAKARVEWVKANKHRIDDARFKRDYGISHAEVEAMRVDQEGKCAICDKYFEKLCIDHHHGTETVRALLCQKCNKGIGLLKECTTTLLAAVKYLLYWEARYKEPNV
jgi:hypothetical protein